MDILAVRLRRIDGLLTGLALGLYSGRVLSEAIPFALSPLFRLAGTALAGIVAIRLVAWLRSKGWDPQPLLVLFVYVLWPRLELSTAAAVGGVAAVALVLRSAMPAGHDRVLSRKQRYLADCIPFLAGLTLYVRTLAPTILPADSGEFQFVSYVLGIAHPPGYPLYTMLAKLFTLLPWGDVAYRVNLFSALTSAATLAVVCMTVRSATGSAIAGWIASAALGLAPTFWAQGTTANIRSLTGLFVALQVYALVAYAESRKAKHLVAFALAVGLGVAHHSSLAPLLLPYLGFLYLSDPGLAHRPRSWIRPLAVFVASFAVLLYLPLRSMMGTPFDPQPIRGIGAFIEHIFAWGFRGDMFYFTRPAVLVLRLDVLCDIFSIQFGSLWWIYGLLGSIAVLVRRRRLFLLVGGVLAVNMFLALTYRAPQTVEYLMPAYVAWASLGAFGAWGLADALVRRGRSARTGAAVLLALALLLPARMLGQHFPSFWQLHQDRSTRASAERLLEQVPEGARILANWHYATPMWYLQYVEQVRPDVEVVYVYPQGAEPIAQTWMHRIEDGLASSPAGNGQAFVPTVVTNRYPEYESLPYDLRPLADGWFIESGPVFEAPEGILPLDVCFDDLIRFTGFELSSAGISPAESFTVRLYWQPLMELGRDYSFFVHLVNDSGVPLGQGDLAHSAWRYQARQVILDEYHIPLLPTVPLGRYRLIAGVYFIPDEGGWRRLTTETGDDSVLLSEVEVRPQDWAPVTQYEMRRSSTSGYVLVGADYDRSVSDQLRLYLHWGATSRITLPYRAVVLSADVPLTVVDLPQLGPGEYLTTAQDLPVGATGLAVELLRGADESAVPWLGPWRLGLGRRVDLPAVRAEDRYVSLGGEMVLTVARFPVTAKAGLPMSTVMTLVASRPLTHDYTVSVKLVDQEGAWQCQDDGTPALGAVPTLKWLEGTTVHDRHDLNVPIGSTGLGILRLSVYDAFSLQTLPVLDERLARLGQGTEIDLGRIAVSAAD